MKRAIKPLIWLVLLAPLPWLVWLGFTGGMGAEPISFMNRYLGDWAIRILILAIAVTPVSQIFRIKSIMRYRRLIGLFCFFYAFLHLTSYVAIDQFFDFAAIWDDIIKRNYITVGMVSFVLLTALAVTSPKAMVKKIGGKRWRFLHKAVYIAAPLVAFHFIMMRKGFQLEPLIYAAIIAILLGFRLFRFLWTVRKRSKNFSFASMNL